MAGRVLARRVDREEDRINNLSRVITPHMWNYDEDAGRIYALFNNKYLILNSGKLVKDNDFAKIGVADDGTQEFYLLNDRQSNSLHACNA